jgi:hypothetical protein
MEATEKVYWHIEIYESHVTDRRKLTERTCKRGPPFCSDCYCWSVRQAIMPPSIHGNKAPLLVVESTSFSSSRSVSIPMWLQNPPTQLPHPPRHPKLNALRSSHRSIQTRLCSSLRLPHQQICSNSNPSRFYYSDTLQVVVVVFVAAAAVGNVVRDERRDHWSSWEYHR